MLFLISHECHSIATQNAEVQHCGVTHLSVNEKAVVHCLQMGQRVFLFHKSAKKFKSIHIIADVPSNT